jgi:hypothetical protein
MVVTGRLLLRIVLRGDPNRSRQRYQYCHRRDPR